MKKTYSVTIDYIGSNPITLILDSKNYRRDIGFYEMKELETVEEFISRKLSTFLETIKDYPDVSFKVRG